MELGGRLFCSAVSSVWVFLRLEANRLMAGDDWGTELAGSEVTAGWEKRHIENVDYCVHMVGISYRQKQREFFLL